MPPRPALTSFPAHRMDVQWGRVALILASLLVALAVIAPMIGLFSLAGNSVLSRSVVADHSILHIASVRNMLGDTLTLLAGVGMLSGAIGIGTAWLVAMYRFPGRSVLAVALVLPLALPTYLAAYTVVELTDFFGPLQHFFRLITGYRTKAEYYFPDVRSMPGAILVYSLVLYPYIYLPARLMFERQGSSIIHAARLHGARGLSLFLRIGLPLARPALAGGMAFALLETLNDVGAAEHLGIESLSLTIRAVWLSRGSLPGAAQIALIALGFSALIIFTERFLRRRTGFAVSAKNSAMQAPMPLRGAKAVLVSLLCTLPVLTGFLIPAFYLISEALLTFSKHGLPPDLLRNLGNSVLLSGIAAILVAVLGGCTALAARVAPMPLTRISPKIASFGYAIPGTVLVIAMLPIAALADGVLDRLSLSITITGSLSFVIALYFIRFAGIGVVQSESMLARLSPNLESAARTLGSRPNKLITQIFIPNLWRALGVAGLLAFVDGMKELPATLLMRPLNTETLATALYAHASQGTMEAGAIEALLILLIGLIPVAALARAR